MLIVATNFYRFIFAILSLLSCVLFINIPAHVSNEHFFFQQIFGIKIVYGFLAYALSYMQI